MPAETEQLQLKAADTTAALRERLSPLRGRRVLLIPPADARLFQRKLDLVLIQRAADRRAIQLALVSQDKRVIANAAELNISCFATVAESENARWKRGTPETLPASLSPAKRRPAGGRPGIDRRPIK